MFENWGGPRPGSGRPSKYGLDANRGLGIAIEVSEVMRSMQKADRERQYESDPKTTLIRDQQRRIAHHTARHVERSKARPYFAPHSKAIDALGRLSGYTVPSYKAEAIRMVARRHNLPVRVVRDCYREFRRDFPAPERPYTFFDTWPRPLASIRQAMEEMCRGKFIRWMLRDPDDLVVETRDPDFPRSMTLDDFANRNKRKPAYRSKR
jgi:hypothetical protein